LRWQRVAIERMFDRGGTTMINRPGKFRDQRWLVAHNAWNTEIAPNQCKTITELLFYGVRGFALDIWGDDEASLHLQHGSGNPASSTPWSVVRDEIAQFLRHKPNEVVTLFFESYLETPTALQGLDASLSRINSYRSGRQAQTVPIDDTTYADLIAADHRLFAFLQEEPKYGHQTMFPVMQASITENQYGGPSLDPATWTSLRKDPPCDTNGALTFMNHFGDTPSGSQWTRNAPTLLRTHADAFHTTYGRYPNYISLDYIDWNDNDPGPLLVFEELP
jgi:hypothetical protein